MKILNINDLNHRGFLIIYSSCHKIKFKSNKEMKKILTKTTQIT